MARALLFDVFGTVLDPSGLVKPLAAITRDPEAIASEWRGTQLQYTFQLAAMGRHLPFAEVTRRALQALAARRGMNIPETTAAALIDAWTHLPVFPDVVPALDRLRSRARLAVVSNGDPDQIEAALSHAGLRSYFDPVVSAAEARSFKPARAVYLRAVERLGVRPADVALVSAHSFDVTGGKEAGLRAIWVNRFGAALDDLGMGPDLEVATLRDVTAADIDSLT